MQLTSGLISALAGRLSWLQRHPVRPRLYVRSPSGHIQESTKECISKWENKSTFLSLSQKSIKQKKKKDNFQRWKMSQALLLALTAARGPTREVARGADHPTCLASPAPAGAGRPHHMTLPGPGNREGLGSQPCPFLRHPRPRLQRPGGARPGSSRAGQRPGWAWCRQSRSSLLHSQRAQPRGSPTPWAGEGHELPRAHQPEQEVGQGFAY